MVEQGKLFLLASCTRIGTSLFCDSKMFIDRRSQQDHIEKEINPEAPAVISIVPPPARFRRLLRKILSR